MKVDYSKQERFKPLQHATKMLQKKTVAIVGLGGLGSHSAEYLVRMGVGKLILIDDDIVEESNLSRQGIYTELDSDSSRLKASVLKERLEEIATQVSIEAHVTRLTDENIHSLLENVDLILDGTDNFTTRFILSDYSVQHHVPWIYASATASIGTVINFIPGSTPCFRCLFDGIKESDAGCDRNGVILPVLTMTTSYQVTEAVKILTGQEAFLEEIRFNIWTREETIIPIEGLFKTDCVCQTKQSKKKNNLYMICSGDSIQVNTTYSFEKIKKLFQTWESPISRSNEMLVETKLDETKRVVGYKTGKIVFYNVKEEVVQNYL